MEAGKKGVSNYGFGTDIDHYITYLPATLDKYISEEREALALLHELSLRRMDSKTAKPKI